MALVIALTAFVGATAASAAQFRAEEPYATVKGTQDVKQKFGVSSGANISCTTSTVEGPLTSGSTTLLTAPAFSGCEISSPISAGITAKTNNCFFIYHNSSEPYENNGTMEFSCGLSESLEFSGGGCTVKYGSQSGRGNVKYINTGGASRNHTITVSYEVTNLTYSVSGLFCALKQGTFENGTLTGTSVLKGSNAGHAVGLYLFNEPFEFHPTVNGEYMPLNVEASAFKGMTIKKGAAEAACSTMRGITKVSEPTAVLSLNIDEWNCWGGPGSIKMNGCTLTVEPKVSEGTVADGPFGISCPGSNKISLNWGGCAMTIGSQGGVGSVHFVGSGSGSSRQFEAQISAKNIKYTDLVGGCASPGVHEDMQLNASLKVAGFGQGIWIN
jgi:hypothetical protein